MSITIRLSRIGRRNQPSFRVVVANTRSKRDGKVLDILGSYNPMSKPETFSIDKTKVKMWQERGAFTTDAVQNLIDEKYKFVLYPSAKKVKRENIKREAKKAQMTADNGATEKAA